MSPMMTLPVASRSSLVKAKCVPFDAIQSLIVFSWPWPLAKHAGTVILHSFTNQIVDEVECSLRDALSVLLQMVRETHIVLGDGC